MCACACALLLHLPFESTASRARAPRLLLPQATTNGGIPRRRPCPPRLLRSNPIRAHPSLGDNEGTDAEAAAAAAASPAAAAFDFLALKREMEDEEVVVRVEAEEDRERSGSEKRRKRQMVRRSGLLAKQVISVRSARSLGFVSELWVDTRSWVVALVEVRPNLLSGEIEKFRLVDIYQMGDVVLVEDEIVMENELKVVGLESLVGYKVVTSGRRNVGKVRGYTFDINSGTMESLELDSFGLSIVPASLVSTYCLFVEDVLDIVSDTIVVHEDAVSRIQRLTKGIWGTQNIHGPGDQMDEFAGFGRRGARSVQRRYSREKISGRKSRRKMKDLNDDWELPMDY